MLQLREFATFAILARGQEFAPLLPPMSNGGEMRASYIGPKGRRVLTLEGDWMARLWDPYTARQVGVFQRGDSKVIETGFSADGLTAFTHSVDGVMRLWDAQTGAFLAETEPRPSRIQLIQPDLVPIDPVAGAQILAGEYYWNPHATRMSNDRILTFSEILTFSLNSEGVRIYNPSNAGPFELWDASNGKWIARLEIPENNNNYYEFTRNGRWIVASDRDFQYVWSASDGKAVAKLPLKIDDPMSVRLPFLSPSGRTMGTLFRVSKDSKDVQVFVHLWDTSSWKRLSITGPFDGNWNFWSSVSLIDDDRFIAHHGIYRAGSATPIAEVPALFLNGISDNRAWYSPSLVLDTSTWQRLQPPPGRKYHPDLARFAADGRFLEDNLGEGYFLIDTLADKPLDLSSIARPGGYQPGIGWFLRSNSDKNPAPLRLPPPDHLKIPPEQLMLWLQVAIRGELDNDGAFVKWDERTWEKMRQKLAATPAPYPDFPFPGRVAQDRSHWLRREYEEAGESDRPRLARQLLERAEAASDRAEANHWRRILSPKPGPTESSAPK